MKSNIDTLDFLEVPIELSQLDVKNYAYFDQLLNHRTIIINNEVSEDVIEQVYLPLRNFENDESDEPVTLLINTIGGSVYDGLFICNVIDNYKKPLNVIVTGYAMSMGGIILCAGSKNPNIKKMCYAHSICLFHNGNVTVQGETGSAEDTMGFNKRINKMIDDYILSNTNISTKVYKSHDRKQWFLTADEMLKYGIVDEIIGVGSEN